MTTALVVNRILMATLVIGATSLGSVSCKASTRDLAQEDSKKPRATDVRELSMTSEQVQLGGVRWEPVKTRVMAESVEIPGQLVPNDDRTARLSAPARGRVVTVQVRIGDRVARWQSVVTLQSEQAASARAEAAKAEAELGARQQAATFAHLALARAERLLELKSVSRQDVERARVDAEQADAQRAQADAELGRAQATLTQLGVDANTGEMILRAPLAGVVLSRDVVPGSVVDAGAPLVTVTDPSTLWLEVAATERVAPALRIGSPVRFSVPELGSMTFESSIQNIGGALDPATRTLPVRGLVRNQEAKLRPAMFVTVRVPIGESRTGVVVPENAVQLLDERRVVFVAQPNAHGGANDGAFAVKSEFARAKIPSES
jgi:cobalt-zinc-cadmium efflux system membrane fusion protein